MPEDSFEDVGLDNGSQPGVYHNVGDTDKGISDGRCPECGADLVPPGRFCEACGNKITDKSHGEIILEIRGEQTG